MFTKRNELSYKSACIVNPKDTSCKCPQYFCHSQCRWDKTFWRFFFHWDQLLITLKLQYEMQFLIFLIVFCRLEHCNLHAPLYCLTSHNNHALTQIQENMKSSFRLKCSEAVGLQIHQYSVACYSRIFSFTGNCCEVTYGYNNCEQHTD